MDSVNYDREDFYGFANVPFHRHVGMRFEHGAEQPLVVALPQGDHELGAERSPAAVYTVAEVAASLAACDALATHASELPEEAMPVMLVSGASFRALAPARGEIRARTSFVGDAAETVRRLTTARKVRATIAVELVGTDDEVAAEAEIYLYIRMMSERRLHAMRAAALGGGN